MNIQTQYQVYDSWVVRLQYIAVPALLLFCRLWVAWVFFNSGMTKIASWDSTLFLFEYEYQVPILPWELAAYLGTATELIIPVFIALGLFTRPFAAILFVFNIIAVVSYPLLWEKGFYDHQLWGLMILINIVWGAGAISVDKLLVSKVKE
ncbi:integral membrane protein [Vibrio ishigakensis]|uniref:Integral membrane protein n=1 Tax=Vibrio ishigakensis TaxID=1481914 RepID=A0A0B8QXM6_9VIBR|nr:integral membrane protein [Vibrio ishigakensis]